MATSLIYAKASTAHPHAMQMKKAKKSRIDLIIANKRLTPAITHCEVDQPGDYPTHCPLIIEVETNKLEQITRELQRPTNFAKLLEDKIQEEVQQEETKASEEEEKGNTHYEQTDDHSIRKKNMEQLHKLMDEQHDKRKYRLQHAVEAKDTNTQWDLIAAIAEEANIDFHNLQGREATKMRGRSRITFNKAIKNLLQGMEAQEENAELVTRAKWLREMAGHHTKLGDKLINVARRILAKARDKSKDKPEEVDILNRNTMQAYLELAHSLAQ